MVESGELVKQFESLSARRAWIEILIITAPAFFENVALRKESVDRNTVETAGGQ